MRDVLALVMLGFFLLYAIGPTPATPVGVQCPTASVQKITTAVHDCCGKVIGFSSRAPKPGDKGFVQCHCAERKNTVQKAIAPNKIQPFLTVVATLPKASGLLLATAGYTYSRPFQSFSFPPYTLPPI